MKHFGDITKLNGAELPVVDVICGGSPCQDLSVAGKRDGLAGERSGLFFDYIRIVKEMREHDRSTGRSDEFVRPRYLVFENVPGLLSSGKPKGSDFQIALTEIVRIAEKDAPDVPMPKDGKWAKSGCLYDDLGRWSVAWRLHDAQFWGTTLYDDKGNIIQRGTPQRRKRIALVADFSGLSAPEVLFERKGLRGDIAESGEEGQGTAGAAEASINRAVAIDAYNHSISGDIAVSLTANTGTSANHAGPSVLTYGAAGAAEDSVNNAIAIDASHADDVIRLSNTVSMQQRDYKGGKYVLQKQEHGHQPLVYSRQRSDELTENEVTSTQSARQYKDATDLVVTAVDCRNGTENESINGTFQAKSTGGTGTNFNNVCRQANTVRRLTPLECERLQGFPDHWTDIGEWADTKGKKHKDADSPRYKALGNSIALPFWFYLLRRISAQYERPATMGSCFDGISGFPLCWERCNGPGTALWASEIDEFCIAVTKEHFPEGDV